ncbi:MAG: TetM/TetW/TetO/TetS family tetracycline resistance ribosomal protection protein [Clostridiales bacterium]|nr:TetM/TetW/TetO/TetS family tetracycline resistance ribosomal protection protein [Clostridiales bacterium]
MEQAVIGILAHVDAGKTTLSEGMLYLSGSIRKLGRVDHQDAFLDNFSLEREWGITIFSKQAILPLREYSITLLDTPGHVDFSAEMERTLQVLDYAILVISGTDGIQGHTSTLWRLLARYRIPTFLFINKMDLPGTRAETVMEELRRQFGEGCVRFGREGEAFQEELALCGEEALAAYLDAGCVPEELQRELIRRRQLFPCFFGSALKLQGVEEFMSALERLMLPRQYPEAFGAKVYKIARDPQGARLTYLKVTGGVLKVKETLSGHSDSGDWEEKVDQIRLYSGSKYSTVSALPAGSVCAVTGLSRTYPGQGLGAEAASEEPVLEPILTYRLLLPQGADPHSVLGKLRQLEEEDPQLHLVWNETLGEIHLQLMGEVQLEVLRELIAQRFGLEVGFGSGNIVYKETIAAPVVGIGHFEPLRHYAEVHLLLEPGPRGSGLQFESRCSEDVLDRNWQRLILTHLEEKTHLGVLTGSPITDMKITLLTGRAHLKHTEGGDFRQATYRAVRQGLKKAESLLLEPWYRFQLEVPTEQVGRAMTDLQRRSADFSGPEPSGELSLLTGTAPVATMRDYLTEVTAYTQGRGRLFCTLARYGPCHDPDKVIGSVGYDSDRDLENPADSVFCSHGAGYVVKWDEVDRKKHLSTPLRLDTPAETAGASGSTPGRAAYTGSLAEDKELHAIYERTYGPAKKRERPARPSAREELEQRIPSIQITGPEYLLVDGYNIIFAWEELAELARSDIGAARHALMDLLSNYQAFKKCRLILVFDAYKVPGNLGEVQRYHDISVVYTKEAETADSYIEKVTLQIGKKHRVRVATSDALEQLIILGHGALRISARAFREEVEQAEGEISRLIAEENRKTRELNKVKYTAKISGQTSDKP